jgi:hypothetical protein
VIKNKYTYINDKLVNEHGQSVMMGWEKPIMVKVADLLSFNSGDVLNIGFGMGIVDTYIKERNPNSHTIIECHPDVIQHIKETGWESQANFIYTRWQDQIGKIGPFDGIYLDTWADARISYVNNLLDQCLKVGGRFSIWYNESEFDMILKNLSVDYSVEYYYVDNDGIIPDAEEQYENGGFYIDPSLDKITIPIITRLR